MALYGMDEAGYDEFYDAVDSGDVELGELSQAQSVPELSGDAQIAMLSADEFFAEDSFQVTVDNDDGDTVGEDIEILTLFPRSTGEAKGMDRYALVWQRLEDAEWYYNLPDGVDEDNFEADAFYGFPPMIDRSVLYDDWCFCGKSTGIYYIPREKMKALLAKHGKEFGIDADQLKDLDAYIDNVEFNWDVDPHELADILEEFLIEFSDSQWDSAETGMKVFDGGTLDEHGRFKQIESMGEDYYDVC
jgi:hypothetical protein